jgi:hypothetical protein
MRKLALAIVLALCSLGVPMMANPACAKILEGASTDRAQQAPRPPAEPMAGRVVGELKTRRRALGYSLTEVSNISGITEGFLENWEQGLGSPSLEVLEKWAAALALKFALMPVEGEARCLHVDWKTRQLTLDGIPVRLSPMEWKALECLAIVPGKLISHETLFQHLYGENRPCPAQTSTVRVLINKLRRLLPVRIEVRRGQGYVISGIAPSSPQEHDPAMQPERWAAAEREPLLQPDKVASRPRITLSAPAVRHGAMGRSW